MPGGNNKIDLPPGHEVIYQDEEMVVSLDSGEELSAEEDAGNVYFWCFEVDEDDEDFPLRWDASEDQKIVLEESDPPGEPVAVLSVLSALLEEQKLLVGAKAASILAKRFKKPLQAIKGHRLGENQEVLYDSDGCVAILTKSPEGPGDLQAVTVYWDKWKDAEPAIWQHDLRDSIDTHEFPQGRHAILPVAAGGMSNIGRVVPMELAEILAKRFGKRIEPPTRPTDSTTQKHASKPNQEKSRGCASVLCLLLVVSVLLGVLVAEKTNSEVAAPQPPAPLRVGYSP